jgi:7-keto-8-aminopelargonate synthetase-like enzyme
MASEKFTHINTAIRPVLHIDGQEYLYFGGTAYLGIPQDPDFLHLYLEGIKLYGTNNGTSRKNNVQLGVYEAAEHAAALRFGAEEALITSSGYLAAQMVLKSSVGKGQMLYAPNAHPALWLDNRAHPAASVSSPLSEVASFADWADGTVKQINESPETSWVLVSNSLNNLFPEIYDFEFVNHIHPGNRLLIVVDDSHGIGILNKGRGLYSILPKRPNTEWIVVASMAKALGVDAGIVLSSHPVISDLKNTNEFLGASPPAAAALHAFIHAEAVYEAAFRRLMANNLLFRQQVAHLGGYRSAPNFPAYLSPDPGLAEKLFSRNILISSFPYPERNSPPISRMVLSSWHSAEQIQQLIKSLSDITG